MSSMKSILQKIILTIGGMGVLFALNAQVYMTNSGNATFASDASAEIITASTDEVSGAINITDNRFAFRIANKSFIGFNSPLQQEHFYENYIETDKYTYSSFQGKIIEKIDPNVDGSFQIRAKGMLSIHGIEQERIIKSTIIIKGNMIKVKSNFQVPLEDHDIRIPKVVYRKIAEIIDVEINADLILKNE